MEYPGCNIGLVDLPAIGFLASPGRPPSRANAAISSAEAYQMRQALEK